MYRPVYNDEAFHQILAIRSGLMRRNVLNVIEGLAINPFTLGDFEVIDRTGRKNQVLVSNSIAITFWADHAVKELRIIDVRKLGPSSF